MPYSLLPRDTVRDAIRGMGNLAPALARVIYPRAEEICESHSITAATARFVYNHKYGVGPDLGMRMVAATYNDIAGEWELTVDHRMTYGEDHHSRKGGARAMLTHNREGGPPAPRCAPASAPASAPTTRARATNAPDDEGDALPLYLGAVRVATLVALADASWRVDAPAWHGRTFPTRVAAVAAFVAELERVALVAQFTDKGEPFLSMLIDGEWLTDLTGRPGAWHAFGAPAHMTYKRPADALVHIAKRLGY